jgi:hypothetical protein
LINTKPMMPTLAGFRVTGSVPTRAVLPRTATRFAVIDYYADRGFGTRSAAEIGRAG